MAEHMLLETTEQWKEIDFAPGYEVSNLGQIRSYKSTGKFLLTVPRLMRLRLSKSGYLNVKLHINRVRKFYRISRLVAMFYVSNVGDKPQVNHKDGNKRNNDWRNLEWVTGSENVQHAHNNGLCNPSRGETHYQAKLSDLQVAEIRRKYICPCVEKFGRKQKSCTHGNTVTLLAIEYGVCFQEIYCLVSGRIRKHVDKQVQLSRVA